MSFLVGLVMAIGIMLILFLFFYPLIIACLISGPIDFKLIKEWFIHWAMWWFIIPIAIYLINKLGEIIIN